jgi:hypothetical protein
VPEFTAATSSTFQSLPLAIAHPPALQPVASTDIQPCPSPAIVMATMLTTQAQDHPLASPVISAGQEPLPFVQQAPPQPRAPEPEPDAAKPVHQIRKKKVCCLFHHPLDLRCCSSPYYSVR